jgi:alkylation response protein AidB-like acyl-CoA dehydrogenase
MDLALTEEQLSVREAFAELFAAESPPARVRAAEVAGFDEGLWRLYAGTGALGIGVPPELGGGRAAARPARCQGAARAGPDRAADRDARHRGGSA